MHVLVAAADLKNRSDYALALPGEIVHFPLATGACPDLRCECNTVFCGAVSHRPTTTARVVDLDLAPHEFAELLRASLARAGVAVPGVDGCTPEDEAWFASFVDLYLLTADLFEAGTVVHRREGAVRARRRPRRRAAGSRSSLPATPPSAQLGDL